jgi:hypothetical protein|tara:strand:- start:1292 stop:1669 length:378 start_codon:yes stop_codon:yes gene_type:complete
MPANVTYVSEDAAQAYANEIGGFVVPIDEDGDGVPEGWRVVAEGPTRGPTPEELAPPNGSFRAAADQEEYLKKVQEAGGPTGKNMGGVIVDELGYRQGGMNFNERGSVKYSKGGAVKGKNFAGTF